MISITIYSVLRTQSVNRTINEINQQFTRTTAAGAKRFNPNLFIYLSLWYVRNVNGEIVFINLKLLPIKCSV